MREQKIADRKTTQESLLEWSENSKQVIVERAGHFIHIERPNVVISEIQDMINEIRD